MNEGDNNSPILQPWIDPELEARIVAMVLGEASDFEREELERIVAEQPELIAFQRHIEEVHQLLKNDADERSVTADDEEWKLSDERRELLESVFSGEKEVETGEENGELIVIPKRKRRWREVAKIAAVVAILMGVGVITVGSLSGTLNDDGFMAESSTDFERSNYGRTQSPADLNSPGGSGSDSWYRGSEVVRGERLMDPAVEVGARFGNTELGEAIVSVDASDSMRTNRYENLKFADGTEDSKSIVSDDGAMAADFIEGGNVKAEDRRRDSDAYRTWGVEGNDEFYDSPQIKTSGSGDIQAIASWNGEVSDLDKVNQKGAHGNTTLSRDGKVTNRSSLRAGKVMPINQTAFDDSAENGTASSSGPVAATATGIVAVNGGMALGAHDEKAKAGKMENLRSEIDPVVAAPVNLSTAVTDVNGVQMGPQGAVEGRGGIDSDESIDRGFAQIGHGGYDSEAGGKEGQVGRTRSETADSTVAFEIIDGNTPTSPTLDLPVASAGNSNVSRADAGGGNEVVAPAFAMSSQPASPGAGSGQVAIENSEVSIRGDANTRDHVNRRGLGLMAESESKERDLKSKGLDQPGESLKKFSKRQYAGGDDGGFAGRKVSEDDLALHVSEPKEAPSEVAQGVQWADGATSYSGAVSPKPVQRGGDQQQLEGFAEFRSGGGGGAGSPTAKGGFVEVSGKEKVTSRATLEAPKAKPESISSGGIVLFDTEALGNNGKKEEMAEKIVNETHVNKPDEGNSHSLFNLAARVQPIHDGAKEDAPMDGFGAVSDSTRVSGMEPEAELPKMAEERQVLKRELAQLEKSVEPVKSAESLDRNSLDDDSRRMEQAAAATDDALIAGDVLKEEAKNLGRQNSPANSTTTYRTRVDKFFRSVDESQPESAEEETPMVTGFGVVPQTGKPASGNGQEAAGSAGTRIAHGGRSDSLDVAEGEITAGQSPQAMSAAPAKKSSVDDDSNRERDFGLATKSQNKHLNFGRSEQFGTDIEMYRESEGARMKEISGEAKVVAEPATPQRMVAGRRLFEDTPASPAKSDVTNLSGPEPAVDKLKSFVDPGSGESELAKLNHKAPAGGLAWERKPSAEMDGRSIRGVSSSLFGESEARAVTTRDSGIDSNVAFVDQNGNGVLPSGMSDRFVHAEDSSGTVRATVSPRRYSLSQEDADGDGVQESGRAGADREAGEPEPLHYGHANGALLNDYSKSSEKDFGDVEANVRSLESKTSLQSHNDRDLADVQTSSAMLGDIEEQRISQRWGEGSVGEFNEHWAFYSTHTGSQNEDKKAARKVLEDLTWLNNAPHRRADLEFTPGYEFGTTDVSLKPEEMKRSWWFTNADDDEESFQRDITFMTVSGEDDLLSRLDSREDFLASIESGFETPDPGTLSRPTIPETEQWGSVGGTYQRGQDVGGSKIVRKKTSPPAGLEEKSTADETFSTFSLNVSDVSFKLAKSALEKGEWPDAEKVRIEEFVNAFDYGDPLPATGENVACRVEQSIHPFLQQRNLVRIAMRTGVAGRAADTPLRLTFLLDNSGSMERADRQETVRRAFAQLASQLQAGDQVTLISFARQPKLLADRVTGEQATKLVSTVKNMPSEGGTNLEAALDLAFEKAKEQQGENVQNRIVLFTDGAANLGDAKPESLSQRIHEFREAGIAFDAAGIVADGLNDKILEAMTRKGDGRYYLLDKPEDADDGFAKQIAGALRPSAKNVKVQVEFNPERVGRYKLLGFEKHRLKKEDFRNDKVDAAEMAAEETGVAVYQIEPLPGGTGDIGSVSVRFRDLSSDQMIEKCWPVGYDANAARPDEAPVSMRLATAASMFAAKLKGGPLGETVDLEEVSMLIESLPEPISTTARVNELREMVRQARELDGSQN